MVQVAGNISPVLDGEKKAESSWWPRNYVCDGLRRVLVGAGRNLDTSGAVMILGATPYARAITSIFVKVGFRRFSIVDANEAQGFELIKDLERYYFNTDFQFVARGMVTQLPSVHTVAVNALAIGHDESSARDLFFFNFLKPGGLWLDLAFQTHSTLAAEAAAIGALVEPGYKVAAWTDFEWARDVVGVNLDPESLARRYESVARTDVSENSDV
jgi:shikimate 5-dehydrogenase